MKRPFDSDDLAYVVFNDSNRLLADGENAFVASLRPGERLGLWGEFRASCMSGSVEVAGWKLGREPQLVRAPLCQAALSFCCPHSSSSLVGGVVRLEKVADALFCPDRNLFSQWLVVAKGEADAVQVFSNSWLRALDEVTNGRVLICGNRGVGKSTLFRFAVNRLLSLGRRVIVVDTDPGQSELGTPGSLLVGEAVAPLLSAGFCSGFHCVRTIAMIAVPGTSPDRDVDYFSGSVTRLAESIPKDAMHVVVNTPGWISGFGLETLCNTYKVMQCGAALHLHDPESHAVPISLGEQSVVVPLVARTFMQPPRGFSAASMRDWKMAEYFDASPVVRLPLEKVCIAIFEGEEVPDHLVLMALLETVVVLMIAPSYKGREGWFCPSLPSDGATVGLAFVRSIVVDGPEGPVFELQTPVQALTAVNVMARMCHETPSTLRSANYTENPSVNRAKHYALYPMTGSKFVLRNKDL